MASLIESTFKAMKDNKSKKVAVKEDFYPNLGGTPKSATYQYDTRHKVKEVATDDEIKIANEVIKRLEGDYKSWSDEGPYEPDYSYDLDESLSEDLESEADDLEVVSNEVTEVEDSENLDQEYSTPQAKILDELSYLLSTEYEAVKWYDEAIPQIEASGLDEDLIISTVLGIEEIRKDEEDHIAHLERLVKQIKKGHLIDGTNGNE